MATGPALGVDWSSGSWLAVVYSCGEYVDVCVEDKFEAIYDTYSEASSIVVDVPIGLVSEELAGTSSEELSRSCDTLARSAVGSRYRSVFTPPCREAAEKAYGGKSYEAVAEKNESVTGKGLSTQAYAIAKGIGEVDSFLQDNEDARETVVESHPEVSFRALAEEELLHSKLTAPGYAERLGALESVIDQPATTVRAICDDLHGTDDEIGVDDVLDALVLALVATAPAERASLPSDSSEDSTQLPMQIVYRGHLPDSTGC